MGRTHRKFKYVENLGPTLDQGTKTMNFNTIHYFSKQDMECLSINSIDIIDSIQALCIGLDEGWVHAAPKNSLALEDGRFYMTTLAAVAPPGFMATKSLGLSGKNSGRGLDSIAAITILFDSETGHPVAIMDGNWITAKRTAAISALAARFMARKNIEIAAFIGCGVQACSHLEIFSDLYPIREIHILGRGLSNQIQLKQIAEARSVRTIIAESGAEAIKHADLIVTSIPDLPNMTPFLSAYDVKAGAFITMVDLARSWIPETLDQFDCIIIDDKAQEANMKSPMLNLELVNGDLRDLITGLITVSNSPNECSAFAFRGLAIGDLALARLAYESACAAGLGSILPR